MRLNQWLGRLTRVALLVPLLLGARIDCGPELTPGLAAVGSHDTESDCNHAGRASHGEMPAPRQHEHHSKAPGGHCPVFHSCALDSAFLGRQSATKDRFTATLLPQRPLVILPHFDLLPDVPPPKA